MLPEGRRNLAFGLFYTGYGVGWLIGSIATGLLYERLDSAFDRILHRRATRLAANFFLASKMNR